MTKEDILLVRGDLIDKHSESAMKWRRSPQDYAFRVTAELIARGATNISIEYAISVLEQLDIGNKIGDPDQVVADKIQELKLLIK